MDELAQEDYARHQLYDARGGQKRRASADARAGESRGGTGFSDSLMRKWGFGLVSAEETHKDAALAHKAGARGGALNNIATMTPGHCSQQMSDFVSRLLGSAVIPATLALVPSMVTKSTEDGAARPELATVGFILPHIWFSFLFRERR